MTRTFTAHSRKEYPMRTWSDVQRFIDKHDLPYRIIRFNMSLAGCLVDTFTDEVKAYTVREASLYLKGL